MLDQLTVQMGESKLFKRREISDTRYFERASSSGPVQVTNQPLVFRVFNEGFAAAQAQCLEH